MWPVDEVGEHCCHGHQVAAVGGRARGVVAVRVHANPVDMMPCIVGKLRKERPLRPPVALPERVHRVHVCQEPGELRDELLTIKAPQPVSSSQPPEHI